MEKKKRLNHLIFTEIKSFYKTGDEDGIIEICLRGDGYLEKKWSEIKNANSKPTVRTSDIFGSARSSKVRFTLSIKLPIIIKNSRINHKGIFLNPYKLSGYLKISNNCLFRLTKYFLIEESFIPRPIRKKIDRKKLAIEYNNLLRNGTYKNKAEIAKVFGVSRTWITKVMNQLK